ncbi:hypothetical protein Nepgr_002137 [Nepenthes gracilis]|uniref:Uncharacterized protein n=1 Tax=Nepenthes gracilis TaxID=150966 RepID=A0AAD3P6E7_NEPGR|nr:hypothetical protein Nepgr_002137 [Nepenthes gracilis]
MKTEQTTMEKQREERDPRPYHIKELKRKLMEVVRGRGTMDKEREQVVPVAGWAQCPRMSEVCSVGSSAWKGSIDLS